MSNTPRPPERTTQLLTCLAIAIPACAAFLVLLGLQTDASSAPRRLICETWRDYYYNVDTGDFIEWAGDEYEHCYYDDDETTRPESPSDDYGGGWGTPRDPKKPSCAKCARGAKKCKNEADKGTNSCITYHRNWAKDWCSTKKKDIDNRLIDDYRCDVIDGPAGKPIHYCYGKGIDRCVDSFEDGSPTRSSTSGRSLTMVLRNWFNIGGSDTTTETWGGRKGFMEACRNGDRIAKTSCDASHDKCKDKAGDCK
jgi:hypothetical protein